MAVTHPLMTKRKRVVTDSSPVAMMLKSLRETMSRRVTHVVPLSVLACKSTFALHVPKDCICHLPRILMVVEVALAVIDWLRKLSGGVCSIWK